MKSCVETPECTVESFLGIPGVCNVTSGLCECPEGYHGKDDYEFFNDCHINIAFQRGMYISCVILMCILLVVTSVTFCYLYFRWESNGFPEWMSIWRKKKTLQKENTDSDLVSSITGADSLFVNVATETAKNDKFWSVIGESVKAPQRDNKRLPLGRRAKVIKTRQREILFSVFMFHLFGVGSMFYYVPMLWGQFSSDGYWYQNFGASTAVASIFNAVWAMSYVWFQSLPSIRVYGKLFDIHSVLLRYPNFVKRATVVNLIIVDVVTFLFLFLIPLLYPEKRSMSNDIILRSYIFFLGVFVVYFTSLCLVIKKLFTQLEKLMNSKAVRNLEAGSGSSNSDLSAFQRGKQTVNILIWMTVSLGTTSILSSTITAFVPFFRTRLYISISMVSWSAGLVSIICTSVFCCRLYNYGGSAKGTPSKGSSDPFSSFG